MLFRARLPGGQGGARAAYRSFGFHQDVRMPDEGGRAVGARIPGHAPYGRERHLVPGVDQGATALRLLSTKSRSGAGSLEVQCA